MLLACGLETLHVALESLTIVWPRVCNDVLCVKVSRRVTIDKTCLTEGTDAWEDGGRIASKKQWWRGGQCPNLRTSRLAPVHSRRTRVSDC
ncbi:hypothetical protein TNIN_15641 [Trichonephila inaurata madagascariensis]|uniref:Uncharacterized protein n=1 Tax=Trichonephila inaurata madagascariensis TaxID=2747483 RepID=A0A8X7CNG3_9ARAC|nr:hypothetical protein TNIN_15641 [Trichonephila inaurata madagascariensis]